MKLKYNNKEIDLIICNSFSKRLLGIMGKKEPITYALLFPKCSSIHTFFCMQNIDVIMTDDKYRIIYFKQNVGKNKIITNVKCRNTFETPNYYFNNLKIGDYLEMENDL